jgi:hypothetical protein
MRDLTPTLLRCTVAERGKAAIQGLAPVAIFRFHSINVSRQPSHFDSRAPYLASL